MYIRTSSFVLLPSEFPHRIFILVSNNLSWCQNSGSFSSNFKKLGCFESTPAYKASSIFTVEIPILLASRLSTAILQGELQFCPSSRPVPQHFSVLCSVSRNLRIFSREGRRGHSSSLQCISIGRIPILSGKEDQAGSPCSLQGPAHTSSRQKQHSSGQQSTRCPYRVPREVPRADSTHRIGLVLQILVIL